MTDTLARNSNITLPGIKSDNIAWHYLQECFTIEEQYKQMLLDGKHVTFDTFNPIDEKMTGDNICKTLSSLSNVDGLRKRNITYPAC